MTIIPLSNQPFNVNSIVVKVIDKNDLEFSIFDSSHDSDINEIRFYNSGGMSEFSIDNDFKSGDAFIELKIKESQFKIFYKFRNSQRRYCNPEAFAGFIGALAKMNFENVLCTGMCFSDATSYPSVTHPNGDSADTAYLSRLDLEQIKVDAFHFFNFKDILRGKTKWYPNLKKTKYSKGHEDHLHAGNFSSNKIVDI